MTFNLKLSLNLLAAGFSLTYLAAPAQAACVSGDCSALGYNKSESACSGDIIRCPFDTSKVFCKENKIEIGDILYSDMTTSNSVISGKTPIGVVFDGERRRALALNEFVKIKWSTENFDIPTLTNYPYYTSKDKAYMNDYDGKSNTKKIIDYCRANSKSCPAAEKAYSYSTTGTKAGDWYLPASAEIIAIANVSGRLNDTLKKIKGSEVFGISNGGSSGSITRYFTYWASTESEESFAFHTGINDKDYDIESKTSDSQTIGGFSNKARPVIAF